MKKHLLLAIGLLTGTFGAQAQLAPCQLTVTKSGTGMTRTYTAASATAGPQYNISIYGNYQGLLSSGSANVLSYTYTQPGYYNIAVDVSSATCTDSAYFTDTVVGPINCSTLTHNLSASGSGATFYFFRSGAAAGNMPYFTAATTYSYGDGTSGTTNSHTYTATGSYLVTATTVLSSSNYGSCTFTDTVTVHATTGSAPSFNCANAHAGFTHTNSGATFTFNNTTTYPSTPGVTVTYVWSGDGGFTATGAGSKTFTYSQNGTYNVELRAYWKYNGIVLCTDSMLQAVTVNTYPPSPNVITTAVVWDSTINAAGASVKIWLIEYDSTLQSLSAVDSALVPAQANIPYVVHDFTGKPAGSYRIKAHMINQPASWTTGFLPTYATNAAYWSHARVLNHSGATVYGTVRLQQGTPLNGPGFVGGLILQGANKGTAAGDPMGAITVLLRDANGTPVASTETDADGLYSFAQVPLGHYTVYPEELNYETIPSSVIGVTAANPRSTGNDFLREVFARKIHPASLSVTSSAKTTGITISPNPAREQLTLQFATAPTKGTQLQLFNLSGQLVQSVTVRDAQQTHHLNLSGLPAGNYLLHLPGSEGKDVYQITVQP